MEKTSIKYQLGFSLLFLIVCYSIYITEPIDDYFIHLKYVENFINYGKPYFNIDMEYNGNSSFGYFVLLSMINKIYFSVQTYLVLASAIYLLNYLLTLYIFKVRYKFLFAFLYFLNPYFLYWQFSGMENYFMITFFLLNYLMLKKSNYKYFFPLNLLAILFRPDYIIVSILTLLFVIIKDNKQVFNHNIKLSLFYCFLLLGAYWVFILHYYNNIIPLSIISKNVNINLTDSNLIVSIKATFANIIGWSYIQQFNIFKLFKGVLAIFIVLLLIVSVVRSRKNININKAYFISVFFIYVSFLVYSRGGYGWYYFLPAYIIIYSVYYAFEYIPNKIRKTLIPMFMLLYLLAGHSYHTSRNIYTKAFYIDLQQQAALYLNNKYLDPNTQIHTGSLGYFGYFSNYIVHDHIGLVTPEIIDIRKKISHEYERKKVILGTMKPDYYIHKQNNNQNELSGEDIELFTNYSVIKRFNSQSKNWKGSLIVLKRKL
jgi:hypothetical protein